MSATDQMRDMLAQLMGTGRDGKDRNFTRHLFVLIRPTYKNTFLLYSTEVYSILHLLAQV